MRWSKESDVVFIIVISNKLNILVCKDSDNASAKHHQDRDVRLYNVKVSIIPHWIIKIAKLTV